MHYTCSQRPDRQRDRSIIACKHMGTNCGTKQDAILNPEARLGLMTYMHLTSYYSKGHTVPLVLDILTSDSLLWFQLAGHVYPMQSYMKAGMA